MTDKQTTKKNLGRAVALLATLGAFVGLTSLPAMATDWTIEVTVSDSTPPACTDPNIEPSWSPDLSVTYLVGNDVDLYTSAVTSGLRPFTLALGLTTGYNSCDMVMINPNGEIEASVSGLDAELSMEELDCTVAVGLCSAELLWNNSNSISGTIDASLVTTTGTKSGILSVVWTPAG